MPKKCFGCGIEKEIDEFHINKRMADGHLNKCKECVNSDTRKNRRKKIDYYRQYDRDRYKIPSRKKKVSEDRVKNKKLRPELSRVGCAVYKAIKSGKLVRGPCEKCGTTLDVQAHHHDYSKPLEVQWLCRHCHEALHHPA